MVFSRVFYKNKKHLIKIYLYLINKEIVKRNKKSLWKYGYDSELVG